MNRSVLKILCVVSGILFAILGIIVVISAVQVSKTVDAASIGIIGGAGMPTAVFLLQKVMRSPVFCTKIAAFLLFSGTGLALLLTKKPKN